jgi:hypothetical protein
MQQANDRGQNAASNSQQRAAAAATSTTGTSALGAAGPVNIQKKTLLGQ